MSSLDQSAAKFVSAKFKLNVLDNVISTRHLHGERFLDHDCHVRHLARPMLALLVLSNIHTRKNIQSKLISRPIHINPGPPTSSVSNTEEIFKAYL